MTLFIVFFVFAVSIMFFLAVLIDKARKQAKMKKERELEKKKREMFNFSTMAKTFTAPSKSELEEKVRKFENRLERESTLKCYSKVVEVGDIKRTKGKYFARVKIERYLLKDKYQKINLKEMVQKSKSLRNTINQFN